jgi:O-antigen/teichoic acid export membrane protein
VQPYIDAIILSRLVPEDAVGWFGAARNVMGTLIAPSLILASATYPSLSRARGDVPALRTGLRSALRPLLWLGAFGGVGTYLFGELAIAIIYGSKGYAPSANILKAFAPAVFLLFVDVLLGYAITACGRAKAFAVAKVASIAVSTVLSLYLVPLFQRSSGNGGIGLIVAFTLSEFVVFGASILLLPRGSMDPALALDAGRAIASAGVTLLLFHFLPTLPPYVALPLCTLVFVISSVALGLVTRRDLEILKSLVRRGRRTPGQA